MNVDLHTHTYPASDCSHIAYRDYIAWCADHGVEAVALTNHGDVVDNRVLAEPLAAEGVLLLHGCEISTLFGDFVVFSPDLDYLATFAPCRTRRAQGQLPDDAACVWVHPGAGGGRSGSAYYPGIERMVAGIVDAVEVYNGNWLGERYVDAAEQIAGAARRRAHGRQRRARGRRASCAATPRCRTPCAPRPTSWTRSRAATTVPHRAEAPRRQRRLGIF